MKLKTILGVLTAAVSTVLLSSAVFAEPTFYVGTPIDLSTGIEVESITAGQILAVPVELTTDNSTDSFNNYSVTLAFDNTLFVPYGLDEDDVNLDTTILDNFYALGGTGAGNLFDASDLKIYAINNFRNANGRRVLGTGKYTMVIEKGICGMGVLSIGGAANANYPEAYFLFEAKKDIPYDELNKEIFTLNSAASYGGASYTLSDGVEHGMSGIMEKANACLSAFKVSIDNDAVPEGLWIQELYAKVGDTTQELLICNNDGTSSIYEFPARILTNATGSDAMAIEVYAKTSSDEEGTTPTGDVLIGTVNLTADSTATSYSAGSLSSNAAYAK